MVKVKRTAKYGRGVYATQRFFKGDVIEVAPVLVIPRSQVKGLLMCYVYDFGNSSGIALGHGSLFNHSGNANVEWKSDRRKQTIRYVAKRPIAPGEQLFINYGYDPMDYHPTKHYLLKKRKKNG